MFLLEQPQAALRQPRDPAPGREDPGRGAAVPRSRGVDEVAQSTTSRVALVSRERSMSSVS